MLTADSISYKDMSFGQGLWYHSTANFSRAYANLFSLMQPFRGTT